MNKDLIINIIEETKIEEIRTDKYFTEKYGFHGDRFFLSNFYPCEIKIGDLVFKNSEAAFHSFKDLSMQKCFKTLDAKESKKLGRKVSLRKDWEQVKDSIMEMIVFNKFMQHPELASKLAKLKDEILIEFNYWHDNYWGVCICPKCLEKTGLNKLGKILTKIKNNSNMFDSMNVHFDN